MAPKMKIPPVSLPPPPPPPPPSFPVGNCEVIVEAKKFIPESAQNSLQITFSKNVKIKISVVEGKQQPRNENDDVPALGSEKIGEYYFVLMNPKDSDEVTKSLVQEVLHLYSKELPAMNFASNTGKESMFLQRCVSKGNYCTLALIHKATDEIKEVVSAISYQIVPSDTHHAEIPLACVSYKYQKKGIGRLMYLELRQRLQRVGIRSIFCWGDQESEGFWLKQGFTVIGEVNKKGRARRLPIKTAVRKALCFPGGSKLMISHLNDSSSTCTEQIKVVFPRQPSDRHISSDGELKLNPECMEENSQHLEGKNPVVNSTGYSEADNLVTERFLIDGSYCNCNRSPGSQDADRLELLDHNGGENLMFGKSGEDNSKRCSCSTEGTKKRIWESSLTSLNSKRVKGSHIIESQSDIRNSLSRGDERKCCSSSSSLLENKSLVDETSLKAGYLDEYYKECAAGNFTSENLDGFKVPSTDMCFRVMLMNIADDRKKAVLTKIIEDLGGTVTFDGSMATHVITGKVRRTLNFCVALCSGAWIISSMWLKESFRNGRFLDEMPFVLKDEEYESKYGTELKAAVVRSKANPRSLLKGHDLCLAAHIQPPKATLTAIIKSAGGNVLGLDNVKQPSSTIFIACEKDMEEALLAVKEGIKAFSSDWLMNCILRQELDLEASQFAESL
ncbi:OLC1v1036622C1 [Oldenlandia corymbosa var. corymbosa]|uniref:OLC1v1036622C1 n=1 Tax=Oldenlandia corymbosa var. corymbosa TaxID=529605 RepID=A0AAV1CWY6_OLDCO|nr:OLC1v1036622C1 [Oldenlandia corymbosa var. corymbosa]